MRRHEKFDRHGGPVVDDDDVLRDGETLRVPLMMRDGMSPLQRAVAEDAAARRIVVVDGLGRPAGHRPGACYLRTAEHTTDHALAVTRDHLRRKAYADSLAELQDAWKGRNNDREVQHVHTDGADERENAYLDQVYDLKIPGTAAAASDRGALPPGRRIMRRSRPDVMRRRSSCANVIPQSSPS